MPLVTNLDGTVILPAGVCAVFAPLLRRAIDEAVRRDGHRFPNEVFDELAALEAAGRATTTQGVVMTMGAKLSAGTLESVNEVTVVEAAALTGRTRQAVQARITRETLPARRDERGHWLIRRENLGLGE
jgi:hypothetical protein